MTALQESDGDSDDEEDLTKSQPEPDTEEAKPDTAVCQKHKSITKYKSMTYSISMCRFCPEWEDGHSTNLHQGKCLKLQQLPPQKHQQQQLPPLLKNLTTTPTSAG